MTSPTWRRSASTTPSSRSASTDGEFLPTGAPVLGSSPDRDTRLHIGRAVARHASGRPSPIEAPRPRAESDRRRRQRRRYSLGGSLAPRPFRGLLHAGAPALCLESSAGRAALTRTGHPAGTRGVARPATSARWRTPCRRCSPLVHRRPGRVDQCAAVDRGAIGAPSGHQPTAPHHRTAVLADHQELAALPRGIPTPSR